MRAHRTAQHGADCQSAGCSNEWWRSFTGGCRRLAPERYTPPPSPCKQVGWMRSMSGWAGYEAAYPAAAEQLAEALVAALGVPDATTPVPMTWPLVMMLAKQPRPL